MSSGRVYYPNAKVRLSTETTVDGVLTDPTTLEVWYRNPSTGVVTTKVYGTDSEVVKDATGKYHIDVTFTVAGNWAYGWKSTGTAGGADEGFVHVQKTSRT